MSDIEVWGASGARTAAGCGDDKGVKGEPGSVRGSGNACEGRAVEWLVSASCTSEKSDPKGELSLVMVVHVGED